MTATIYAGERPKPPSHPVVLKAERMVDVVERVLVEPGVVVVEGEHIRDVAPERVPDDAEVIELGDVTLLPGLMDMELNFLMGGAGSTHMSAVQDDPAMKLLRAVPACRKTLLAGFTTVRNLGIFVQTGGLLLDVSLMRAVDAGWFPGPRIFPSGHAITPTGGHLDPTMFAGIAPGMMPLTVEEGIANGVSEVQARGALPDQVRRDADQGVRVWWCHVAHRSSGCAALLRRGVVRDRRRGPPPRYAASLRTPTATTGSEPPSRQASTASSTRR